MENIFNPIGYIFGYVLWFFFDLFDNYPLAIICFCVVIRLLIFPFDIKSRMASAKMARLSKKQSEIQKKYKNNKEKLNEELAKLYQQEGGNPFSGCLPMLVPFISLMGVFYAIVKPLTNMFHISADKVTKAFSLSGASGFYGELQVVKSFPSLQNLMNIFNQKEINDVMDFNKGFHFFGMDLSRVPNQSPFLDPVRIFPVLGIITLFLTIFLNQKFNPTPSPQGGGCMKFLPYTTSIIYIMVIVGAPVALSFYYVVANILTIIQTFLINKFYSKELMTAKAEARRIALRDIQESDSNRNF